MKSLATDSVLLTVTDVQYIRPQPATAPLRNLQWLYAILGITLIASFLWFAIKLVGIGQLLKAIIVVAAGMIFFAVLILSIQKSFRWFQITGVLFAKSETLHVNYGMKDVRLPLSTIACVNAIYETESQFVVDVHALNCRLQIRVIAGSPEIDRFLDCVRGCGVNANRAEKKNEERS